MIVSDAAHSREVRTTDCVSPAQDPLRRRSLHERRHFPLSGGRRWLSACPTSAAANAFAPSQGEMPGASPAEGVLASRQDALGGGESRSPLIKFLVLVRNRV